MRVCVREKESSFMVHTALQARSVGRTQAIKEAASSSNQPSNACSMVQIVIHIVIRIVIHIVIGIDDVT